MSKSTLNPSRIPNVAKYRTIASFPQTWANMVNRTNFNGPNGCWEWMGQINENGYGVHGTSQMGGVLAHRLALHVAGRPVPQDQVVDHLCRNRKCVNPEHLEIVSHKENLMRGSGYFAVNARKTHCVNGHEFTPDNTRSELNRHANHGRGGIVRQCLTCLQSRVA